MKRKLLLLAISAVSVIAVGCNLVNDNSDTESKSDITNDASVADTDIPGNSETNVISGEITDAEVTASGEVNIAEENESDYDEENDDVDYDQGDDSDDSSDPSADTLDELVEKNFDCMVNIFSLGSLASEGSGNGDSDEEVNWNDENSYIRKVTDSRFPDYAAFSEYIHSIYTESTANMLLNDYPYEGDPKYRNKDGELYIDLRKDGSKGYYVNWKNRTISIDEKNENTCRFTVKTTETMPSDNPVEEPYTIDCTAVYENGRWVLEKMYS